MSKNSEILLTDSAVDFLKEEIGEGGTEVIANPELTGDEANLTGLQVNDIKYKVPQGGTGGATLYQHSIYMRWGVDSNTYRINCYIISSKSTSLSLAEVKGQMGKMTPVQLHCEVPKGQSGSFNLVGICRNAGGTPTTISGYICGVKTEYNGGNTVTAVEEEFETASNPTIVDEITQI